MYAERMILETDSSGKLINLPKLPANKQVEAIFLVVDKTESVTKRTPHSDIAGKLKINGDLLSSAPATDWEFSL